MPEFMILKLSLILSIVVTIGTILVVYVLFTQFRNVYTQKILFLNDEFARMDREQIIQYKIGRYKRFRAKLEYENLFPPKIISGYTENEQYRNLIDRLDNKEQILSKVVKRSLIVLFVLLALHLIAYLVFIQ